MNAAPDAARPGYQQLTPARVLDALDTVGLRPDGRLLQLNSYENRVHQVFLEDGSAVVTKFYRPGRWRDEQILEEHGFAFDLAAAEVPVIAPRVLDGPAHDGTAERLGQPPSLARWSCDGEAYRFAVWPRCAGREPELEQPETLRRIGRFIGRLHAVGRQRPFVHRYRMDPLPDGERALQRLLELGAVPETERPAWLAACRQALDAMAEALHRHGTLAMLRLHGDCHLGNVLWRDGGPYGVDLDDACTGPAVQDLWMLVSGDSDTLAAQLRCLLEGYTEWSDFDPCERLLIEPLRTLRMLRHAAWLAERWSDPAFPAAFAYFGSAAYWSQQTTQLREQAALMAATEG
ncbi:serine/threonine protein kinase [Pseudorhodoferax sp.]|uniref:serine/threonine protein kinase n=1 Tax=Pseudorhodoferax sp. TaxID=1993553 RepID=UPI002DD65D75|nr:serine/threonine protein kinase [Pseudorhodoferax sp.]